VIRRLTPFFILIRSYRGPIILGPCIPSLEIPFGAKARELEITNKTADKQRRSRRAWASTLCTSQQKNGIRVCSHDEQHLRKRPPGLRKFGRVQELQDTFEDRGLDPSKMVPCVLFAVHLASPFVPRFRPLPEGLKRDSFVSTASCTVAQAAKWRAKIVSLNMITESMPSEVREKVVNVRISKVSGPDDREMCMAAATIRCATFYGGIQEDASRFIEQRFSLFQITRSRMNAGSCCLVAKICEPMTLEALESLGLSTELCQEHDRRALEQLEQLEERLSSGQITEAVALSERGRILEDWKTVSFGKGPAVVGAVDLSTHEFKRSDVWMRDRDNKGAKVNLWK
jgi:hypothetical protein